MSKDRPDDKVPPPITGNRAAPQHERPAPPDAGDLVIVSIQTPPGIPFAVIINGRIIT